MKKRTSLVRCPLVLPTLMLLSACSSAAARPSATPHAPESPEPPRVATDATRAPVGGSAAAGEAASAEPAATPVGEQAATLRGIVDGKEFVGRGACATTGDRDAATEGKLWLRISNVELDPTQGCRRPDEEDARMVRVVATWRAGERTVLDGQWIGVTTQAKVPGGATKSLKATGHVEVLRAPSKNGEVGRVRVSIQADELSVEGDVDVALFEDL